MIYIYGKKNSKKEIILDFFFKSIHLIYWMIFVYTRTFNRLYIMYIPMLFKRNNSQIYINS